MSQLGGTTMRDHLALFSGLLIIAAWLMPVCVRAEVGEYTDAEIKEKFAFISCLAHGDENGSHIRWALHMAGNDTNRFARVLRELAVENTNQTSHVIRNLGLYKTPQSLPFLYSYATNATYGADALKSILAIEGVNSDSLTAVNGYLFSTNWFSFGEVGRRSDVCTDVLDKVFKDSSLADFRPTVFCMATNFLQNVELMPNVLDGALCNAHDDFRFSKRRLSALRSAKQRIALELEDAATNNYEVGRRTYCYTFQTNYLQNAINELVAYPESNLPD